MKKTYLLLVLMSLNILSGCGNTSIPTTKIPFSLQESESQLIPYKSNLFSLDYPKDYKVEEKDDMVIVSNSDGKIIIGGFKPSVGHPEANENQVVFQKISYNKDPKSELDAIPAALYYRNGDTKIENELKTILETVISRVPKISQNTDLQTYRNTQYGFQLTIPSSWGQYKVEEKNDVALSEVNHIYFKIPTTATNSYFDIIALSVYPISEWKKIEADEGPKPTQIGQSDQFVFAYDKGQDILPPDLANSDLQVDQTIKSFQLIQP